MDAAGATVRVEAGAGVATAGTVVGAGAVGTISPAAMTGIEEFGMVVGTAWTSAVLVSDTLLLPTLASFGSIDGVDSIILIISSLLGFRPKEGHMSSRGGGYEARSELSNMIRIGNTVSQATPETNS